MTASRTVSESSSTLTFVTTEGITSSTDLLMNRGVTYEIINSTARTVRFLQDGLAITADIAPSATGSVSVPPMASNVVVQGTDPTTQQSIAANIDTTGPVSELLAFASISSVIFLDGLLFSRTTTNLQTSDRVNWVKLLFSESTPENYKEMARNSATILTTLIDGSMWDAAFGSIQPEGFQVTMSMELSNQGANGTLAYAGATEVYSVPFQPFHTRVDYVTYGADRFLVPVAGLLNVNTNYTASMEANGTIQDVIMHEMCHILGFGTFWSVYQQNLKNSAGVVKQWGGGQANAYFTSIGGIGAGVPVEEDGGAGTAGSHWDEMVLDSELMTGFAETSNMPLSKITAYAFADMGWKVDLESSVIETYALPGSHAATHSSIGCCSSMPLDVSTVKSL